MYLKMNDELWKYGQSQKNVRDVSMQERKATYDGTNTILRN